MMRSSAYNRFGVLMGTSWPASCPRWYGLREDSLPMITLFPSQGDFYATAFDLMLQELVGRTGDDKVISKADEVDLWTDLLASLPDVAWEGFPQVGFQAVQGQIRNDG